MAAGTGRSSNWCQGESAGDASAPKIHHQEAIGRGLLGLVAASTAIILAVTEPPPCLDKNAHFVALMVLFFSGMTQVIATVWVAGDRRLVAVAVAGIATGTGGSGRQAEAANDGGAPKLHRQATFERSLFGLAAASTAITLVVSLDRNSNAYYFVALSGLFFAGMTQVIAFVWAAAGRHHVLGRKLIVAAGLTAAPMLM